MPNVTREQAIEIIYKGLEVRYNFLFTDEILPPPTREQIEACIEDGLSEVNSFPPQTFHTVEGVCSTSDTRWKSTLYVATAKRWMALRMIEWALRGYDSPIPDLPIESKRSEYQEMLDAVGEDFNSWMERLKSTSEKRITSARVPMANPITRPSALIGRRSFNPGGRW